MNLIHGCIDEPVAQALTYRNSLVVRGFAFSVPANREVIKISAMTGAHIIGSTSTLYDRPDVAAVFPHYRSRRSGFEVLCTLEADEADESLEITIIATLSSGEEAHIGSVAIRLTATDYRHVDYGRLIDPSGAEPWKRDDIYGSGPPSPDPSLGCLGLLKRYIAPGETVLDVGCGVGAYADGLIAHGVDWTGCEAAAPLCATVIARGLPCVQVIDNHLPFEDAAFDRSICIEVLEHIPQPAHFVAEIARVTREAAYFSVPNAELIPLMRPLGAVPWHLLELDHKNFFSRYSLEHLLRRYFMHVEILQYGPLSIKSIEGLPLPCHLFAVASGVKLRAGAHERAADTVLLLASEA